MRYRHLRRTTFAVLAALLLVLLGVAGMVQWLNRPGPRRQAARWLEEHAARAGVGLVVDELRWGALPPRVELTGARLELPWLEVEAERLSAELARMALARGRVVLGRVAGAGVRIRLRADALPERRDDARLRLEVRRLDLERVELEGAQLPGRVDLTAGGLSLQWEEGAGGVLRAREIGVRAPGMEPVTVGLEARLGGGAEALEVPRFVLSGRGLDLGGSARLARGEPVRLTADGRLDLAELDRTVRARAELAGEAALHLELEPGPALRARVRVPRLEVAGFVAREVGGRLELADGRLVGELERARFAGGEVRGSYRLERLKAPYPHRVRFAGEGVALAGLLEALRVPPAGLAARGALEGELAWEGTGLPRGEGWGTARLRPAAGPLPVSGRVDARLTPDGLLHLRGDGLAIGGSTVRWEGPLVVGSWEPSWVVAASPVVLEEIGPAVNAWVGSEVVPAGLAGRGELHASLAGPWQQLRVGLRLEAAPLAYPPMHVDRATLEATVADGRLVLGPSAYRLGSGSGEVDGEVRWSPEAGAEQLRLHLRGRGLPLAEVAGWLDVPADLVAGEASFAGRLFGPVERPRGSFALGLVGVRAGGVDLGDGAATVDLGDGTFTARGLAFDRGLEGQAEWAVLERRVGARAAWPALDLAALDPTAAGLIGPRVALTAELDWPLDGSPRGEARLEGPSGRVEGALEDTGARLAGRVPDVVELDLDLPRSADGSLHGGGNLRVLDAGRLLERLGVRDVPLQGEGAAALTVTWPAGEAPRLEATLTELAADLARRPLRLLAPAVVRVAPNRLELEDLRLAVAEDELELGVELGPEALMVRAEGTLDALLLRLVAPAWEPAGTLTGGLTVRYADGRSALEGAARVARGSFRLPGGREVVSGVDGVVRLAGSEVLLEEVTGRLMGGEVAASGRITLEGAVPELALAGTVDGLEYPLLDGFAPRLRGSWSLEGRPERLRLGGELEVERATLRRDDDLATLLMDWFGEDPPPTEPSPLELDLEVRADRTMEARSPFLRLVGSAALSVTGPAHDPGVVGQVEFLEGGEVHFQGLRYELDRAVLTFTDPTRIEPVVEVQARTWVEVYEVTVTLSGTPERLEPAFASSPPLPQDEVVALLAIGHRREDGGGGAVGLGLASTVLAREFNAELERRARTLLPVDQVRVDPFAEVATGNPAARVTVVKQVSPTWSVIVQSNLSTNREEAVTSRWLLGRGLFLEASRDLDGTYAADLKLRRRY